MHVLFRFMVTCHTSLVLVRCPDGAECSGIAEAIREWSLIAVKADDHFKSYLEQISRYQPPVMGGLGSAGTGTYAIRR